MRTFKLTIALSFLILAIASCKKDHNNILRSNDNILLTAGQMAPANVSSGSAKLEAIYSNKTRVMNYTVKWTGLAGNVTAVRIHGPADPGFNNAIIQSNTVAGPAASGTYTNTLTVENVAVKEDDLLNGKYYMVIYTSAYPAGEVRGQIVFE
jgi:hypothetical protein